MAGDFCAALLLLTPLLTAIWFLTTPGGSGPPLLRGRDAFGRRAGENDVRAALGEAERDRVADATRRAGHDGDLPVESEVDRRMLLLLLAAARDGARDRGGRGDAGEAAQHGRLSL